MVSNSQNTLIPDNNFEQALIDLGLDSGPLDGFVLTANINAVTNLDINNKYISDLTGIEDFVALTALDCSNNTISNIDVTKNLRLQILWCFNNLLTQIDTSHNQNLISLVCNDNFITDLNITFNPSLNVLVCSNNFLTDLNLDLNPNLNYLDCDNNLLTTLDVTKNITLNRIVCSYNMLSNLDVSNNPNLSNLICDNNQLTTLELGNNNKLSVLNCGFNRLSVLDVSKNPSLTTIACNNNNLCQLNLKNGNNSHLDIYFVENPFLNCVVVDDPSVNHSRWYPTDFSNYVSSLIDCVDFVNVDMLNNVVTNSSYILPTINFGNYFTQPNANGIALFPGDVITFSQTIYIYNEAICASNESSFYVLITNEDYYIPKFFTPNNDGSHDYWEVLDFSNAIKNITIYDRYGKLLKALSANSGGWNGTYRGQLMESNDYWYLINLNSGELIKGHFTLKR